MTDSYHPIVFWGQTKDYILLSVKVKHAKNAVIDIKEETISFSAEGEGSNGQKSYNFNIKYYLPILPNSSSWKLKEDFVEIKLKKEFKDPWQRFTYLTEKIPWLKCDFNNFFFDESDYGSDESEKQINENKQKAFNELLKKPHQFEQSNKFYEDVMKPRVLYLILFNLFQYAGYLYVFGACLWVLFKYGMDGKEHVFHLIRDQLAVIQIVAIAEIIHAYLGWVKSSPIIVFTQVFGRNMVLFMILIPHESLYSNSSVYWLALAWSSIEIIRYPYYLLMLLGEKIDFLTWLRYTAWVPLFPIGFMSEGKLIINALPLLEESKRFSIELPNKYNFQFNFVTFLYFYIPCTAIGFYFLMNRMYQQRRQKIGPVLKKDWGSYSFLQFLVETLGPKSKNKNQQKTLPIKSNIDPNHKRIRQFGNATSNSDAGHLKKVE